VRLLITAVLTVAVAGCGSAQPSTTPAAGGSASRAARTPDKPRPTPAPFDPTTIKIQRVFNQSIGGVTDVYFLAKGPPATHITQAVACAKRYLAQTKGAFCYAFPSEAAFRYAKVDRSGEIGMTNLCWSAMAGRPPAGGPLETNSTNPVADLEHCPDAHTGTPGSTPTPDQGTRKSAVDVLAAQVGSNVRAKPTIPKPSGEPPAELIAVDIVKGAGRPAAAGNTLTVDYVGSSWSTGKEFDASWDRGQPFPVTLGQGQVIQGWERGLVGMREGGRRLLVIPPALGYGSAGSPPKIGPNETLIFVVDARKVG
jgi:peptidylprolyl isomerase